MWWNQANLMLFHPQGHNLIPADCFKLVYSAWDLCFNMHWIIAEVNLVFHVDLSACLLTVYKCIHLGKDKYSDKSVITSFAYISVPVLIKEDYRLEMRYFYENR